MIASAGPITRRILTAVLAIWLVTLVFGYVTGWPAWQLLITLFSWPLAAFSYGCLRDAGAAIDSSMESMHHWLSSPVLKPGSMVGFLRKSQSR